MFFGLDPEKLILIAVIAAVVIGPERLPRLAQQASRFLARARVWATDAKSRVKDEMGDDVDWRQLDPRQYDPRRIVRQALLDEPPVPQTDDVQPVPFKPDQRWEPQEGDVQPAPYKPERPPIAAPEEPAAPEAPEAQTEAPIGVSTGALPSAVAVAAVDAPR